MHSAERWRRIALGNFALMTGRCVRERENKRMSPLVSRSPITTAHGAARRPCPEQSSFRRADAASEKRRSARLRERERITQFTGLLLAVAAGQSAAQACTQTHLNNDTFPKYAPHARVCPPLFLVLSGPAAPAGDLVRRCCCCLSCCRGQPVHAPAATSSRELTNHPRKY